jgi:hypothetical protein
LSKIFVTCALLLLAAAPARSQDITISLNGAFDAASLSWSQSRTFTEYLEDARYDVRYDAEAAPGFDVGIQVALFSGVGPVLSLSQVSRDVTGSLDATIPNPLYFDRDRSASIDLSGFSYSEQAVHMGLGWQGRSGALELAVFGGLTLFTVKVDAVESNAYDPEFPFDSITLRPPQPVEQSESPSGFHVGGRIDWRVATNFGLGAQLRYSAASASFNLPEGDSFDIDAGGLQVAAGLRIYF